MHISLPGGKGALRMLMKREELCLIHSHIRCLKQRMESAMLFADWLIRKEGPGLETLGHLVTKLLWPKCTWMCTAGEKRAMWSKLQLTGALWNCNLQKTSWLSLLEEHRDELLPTRLSGCDPSSVTWSLSLTNSDSRCNNWLSTDVSFISSIMSQHTLTACLVYCT